VPLLSHPLVSLYVLQAQKVQFFDISFSDESKTVFSSGQATRTTDSCGQNPYERYVVHTLTNRRMIATVREPMDCSEKNMSISSHDDFCREPVSGKNLRPWWYLLIIEMGVMISIPIFVVGGQLGLGLTLQDLVIATFCGAAILGVIGGLTARLGAITRCSTALIARLTFGRKGASCIALLLSMGMVGWWGVQTEMFANAVAQLAEQLFGIHLSREIMIGLGGVAMITTAALGIRAIGRLSYIAVPLLLSGLLYALSSLLKPGVMHTVLSYHPSSTTSLAVGAAAATVAGGFIVGASMNPDYSRFAKTNGHALAYAITDYALVYPLLLVACGVVALIFNSTDIMIHLVPSGFSWVVFLMMMFATWAANDCNLYSCSLSLGAVFQSAKRSQLAVLAGFVGIALAEFHVVGHMISFLTLLGILIAPVSGVFIINSLARTTPVTTDELAGVQDWNLNPMLAWTCGALVGYIATPKAALGLGLITLTSLPTLDSIIAATATMAILKVVQRRPAPTASREKAPSLAGSLPE
jgi:cytosine permease